MPPQAKFDEVIIGYNEAAIVCAAVLHVFKLYAAQYSVGFVWQYPPSRRVAHFDVMPGVGVLAGLAFGPPRICFVFGFVGAEVLVEGGGHDSTASDETLANPGRLAVLSFCC